LFDWLTIYFIDDPLGLLLTEKKFDNSNTAQRNLLSISFLNLKSGLPTYKIIIGYKTFIHKSSYYLAIIRCTYMYPIFAQFCSCSFVFKIQYNLPSNAMCFLIKHYISRLIVISYKTSCYIKISESPLYIYYSIIAPLFYL
jgi:hypothetical protein